MTKLTLATPLLFALVGLQDPPKEADLLLHLTFDDGKAEGVSGKVEFAEGVKGSALKLDGSGGYVQIANSEALDKVQADSYSLAAWFRPDSVPPGTESDNNARHAILVKEGYHTGLSYNSEKQFIMEHWLAPAAGGEQPVWAGAGTWEDSCDAAKWYHVAGVVDRKAGTTKLYLNGELKNTAEWEANKASRDPGKSPWRVGIAGPGAKNWSWPAKGLIDDVRIYKKVLSDAEVTALYKAGVK
ncbi:MAG: LamG domain-containing protein [Planctomycetes bacterium]|nr:LamG domain-containing protein [Planctomycetota bacterium]